MTTNQKESRKDILNVEKVHFTTDGNKKVCMFVDYKTNITEEYVLNASIFERVENNDWKFLSGEAFFVCDHQGCITWDWDALSNLKSKSTTILYLARNGTNTSRLSIYPSMLLRYITNIISLERIN